jgi:hypothetical protein
VSTLLIENEKAAREVALASADREFRAAADRRADKRAESLGRRFSDHEQEDTRALLRSQGYLV